MAKNQAQEEARAELQGQYGEFANAEELIAAHDEKHDPVLVAALHKPVEVAPEDMDFDSIAPRYGGVIASAAIRGGLLVVVEDVAGRLCKWHEEDPRGAKAKSATRTAQTPTTPTKEGDPPPAPENITADEMRDRLKDEKIDVPSSARNKAQLWALVPAAAKVEMGTAADARDAQAVEDKRLEDEAEAEKKKAAEEAAKTEGATA